MECAGEGDGEYRKLEIMASLDAYIYFCRRMRRFTKCYRPISHVLMNRMNLTDMEYITHSVSANGSFCSFNEG